jgi:tetratricopeptide (TPR) repeat protein
MQQGLTSEAYFAEQFFTDLARSTPAVAARTDAAAVMADAFGRPLPMALARLVDFLATHDVRKGLGAFMPWDPAEIDLFRCAPDGNVFEQLMSHPLGFWTLVAAFADCIALSCTGSGDIWLFALTENDGKSEVALLDHELMEIHVVADSVESFALMNRLLDEGAREAPAALEGRIHPYNDAELAPKREYVSRWPRAEECDGMAELAYHLTGASSSNSLSPLPGDPDAAMATPWPGAALLQQWWLYLSGQDNQVRALLPASHRHPARLLRDSADLLEAILAGRRHVGPIADIETLRAGLGRGGETSHPVTATPPEPDSEDESQDRLDEAVARADEKFRQQDFEGAIAIYEDLVRRMQGSGPDAAWLAERRFPLLANSAYALQQTGRHAEAVARIEQALAVKSAPHLWKAACFSYGELERFDDMLRCAHQAIALLPDDDFVWQQLGIASSSLHDAKGAIAAFRKSISLNPRNAYAQLNLAYALIEDGQAGYVDCLARAFQLEPSLQPLAAAEPSVVALRRRDTVLAALFDKPRSTRKKPGKKPKAARRPAAKKTVPRARLAAPRKQTSKPATARKSPKKRPAAKRRRTK